MDLKSLQRKYKISDEDISKYRYQPDILSMLTMDGFYDRYCHLIGFSATNEEAFESANRQFKSYFGVDRYKNYETFASALSRYLKQKRDESRK